MNSNSIINTDIHTHLLPDIDCSGDPKTSANIIKSIEMLGVSSIVLTPHFYPNLNNSVRRFVEKRDKNIAALLNQLDSEGINSIRLIPAAEVLLCRGLENMEDLEMLCFEGTNNILIEMPDPPWNPSIIDTLINIKKHRGLNVIIAHVERYGKSNAKKLISLGFKVQLNAESFASLIKRHTLINWIKDGHVVGIGSDIHVHSSSTPQNYNILIKASKTLSKHINDINKRSCELLDQ
jgi:tyrosine-protein phosphatase YwqE